jgi:hypothetical protein
VQLQAPDSFVNDDTKSIVASKDKSRHAQQSMLTALRPTGSTSARHLI